MQKVGILSTQVLKPSLLFAKDQKQWAVRPLLGSHARLNTQRSMQPGESQKSKAGTTQNIA